MACIQCNNIPHSRDIFFIQKPGHTRLLIIYLIELVKGIVEYTFDDYFACFILKQNTPTGDSIMTINDDITLDSLVCQEFGYQSIILPKGQYIVKFDTSKFQHPYVFVNTITTPLSN